MNEETFVASRESEWHRFRVLCDKADFSPTELSQAEFREFLRLYRRICRDLTYVRTRSDNVALLDLLNDLAGSGYGVLYRTRRGSPIQLMVNGIAVAAQTVRRRAVFIAVSAMLFFGSAFLTYFLTGYVPETRETLIPEGFEQAFEGWRSGKFDERTADESLMATSFYASNNPRASLTAAAAGVSTFGLFSIYSLATNGGMLGVLARDVAPRGHLGFLLSGIYPHGVPELSGIIIAGAAGMLFGWAAFNPGRRSRAESLRLVAKDGMVLLGTSVTLMFIAAPIEGFFSFNPNVPMAAKIAVGTIEVVFWGIFWTQFGKESAPATGETPTVNAQSTA
ncbi:MAG: stage II sporulation protein M [Fimbriimonadaceae bacterium]|nr:stage II sporulation protein M [Fimbriimonadaceae bacterium]